MPHPYREPEPPNEPPSSERSGADIAARTDDAVLAVVLFVVGALGVFVGLYADRATELTAGLVLVALSAKVAWESRQISI